MSAEAAGKARDVVRTLCPTVLDPDEVDYLVNIAGNLFEDGDLEDPNSIVEELKEAAEQFFETAELPPEDCLTFAERVVRTALGQDAAGGGSSSSATAAAGKKDCLIRVPNLLLMYGGSPQPLLKNATLELHRGRRYGVVGANGTGKTTLMAKLATRDIAGFPRDVRVVHLRHEAILRGVKRKTTARQYAEERSKTGDTQASEEDLNKALQDVGFVGEDLLGKEVFALSGGWQMRLALACAMAQKANLLLLDEPTNHLDVEATAWLVAFILQTCVTGEDGGTAMIVSHDEEFLNQVCTDVIHFTPDAKLMYHEGDFGVFKKEVLKGDEAKAQQLLEVAPKGPAGDDEDVMKVDFAGVGDRLLFPNAERILGAVPGKPGPVVLSMKKLSFTHKGAASPVLDNLNLDILSTSRIGIVGKNGAGKSTLLSLIGGRLKPTMGEMWSHSSFRLIYIAQHHESQIGQYLENTPMEYMQMRFRRGYDPEALPPHLQRTELTARQLQRVRELCKKLGKRGCEPEAILGRQIVGKDYRDTLYEIKWQGLSPADNTFEKRSRLKSMNCEYMADEYDMWMAMVWGSSPERPLTEKEIVSHFEDFGLPEQVSTKRKLAMLSSGQRSKLMLAASFWTRPHFICLDEPTNYLDTDTVEALTNALRRWRGGYAIVSHSETFVEQTCEEIWTVADGGVTKTHKGPLQDADEKQEK